MRWGTGAAGLWGEDGGELVVADVAEAKLERDERKVPSGEAGQVMVDGVGGIAGRGVERVQVRIVRMR